MIAPPAKISGMGTKEVAPPLAALEAEADDDVAEVAAAVDAADTPVAEDAAVINQLGVLDRMCVEEGRKRTSKVGAALTSQTLSDGGICDGGVGRDCFAVDTIICQRCFYTLSRELYLTSVHNPYTVDPTSEPIPIRPQPSRLLRVSQ